MVWSEEAKPVQVGWMMSLPPSPHVNIAQPPLSKQRFGFPKRRNQGLFQVWPNWVLQVRHHPLFCTSVRFNKYTTLNSQSHGGFAHPPLLLSWRMVRSMFAKSNHGPKMQRVQSHLMQGRRKLALHRRSTSHKHRRTFGLNGHIPKNRNWTPRKGPQETAQI